MLSWSTKRRLTYIGSAIGVVVFIFGGYLILTLYDAPNCFDGEQNQNELGIDCGGSCQFLCADQLTDPAVLFVRSFEVTSGVYNSVAYIENQNFDAGIREVSYIFRLLDANNQLITERSGSTYLTPGDISPVFESGIETGGSIPVRTFFEFDEPLKWSRVEVEIESPLLVKSRVLTKTDTLPRLDVVLENTSAFEIPNIEVVAIIFNALGNAIAASETFIEHLPRRSETNLVFTWPEAFTNELEACISPVDVVLLLDTSGSMNDDGLNPPQPLTDAKNAASDFVGRLGSIDRSGLISFATNVEVLQTLTLQHAVTKVVIDQVVIKPEEEGGFTNTGAAIFEAVKILTMSNKRDDSSDDYLLGVKNEVIVLLTDGKANAPEVPGGEQYAMEGASRAKSEGIELYTIGLGDGVNKNFLKSVADKPEHFYQAATSRDLDGVYRQISDSICERGAAVVEVIPRTESAFTKWR